MNHTLLDVVAVFMFNGDHDAARQNILEVEHEECTKESEEEFQDWYESSI